MINQSSLTAYLKWSNGYSLHFEQSLNASTMALVCQLPPGFHLMLYYCSLAFSQVPLTAFHPILIMASSHCPLSLRSVYCLYCTYSLDLLFTQAQSLFLQQNDCSTREDSCLPCSPLSPNIRTVPRLCKALDERREGGKEGGSLLMYHHFCFHSQESD